eukprot:jgi/Ulvmu1/9054/UM005_0147.1
MTNTRIAHGGDEILQPQSFYGKSPARPAALRTIDANGDSNVTLNKALTVMNPQEIASKAHKRPKEKLPAKPKSAASLFAEEEVNDHVLAQSSSFPLLDMKQFKRQTQKVVMGDSLKAWHDGKVPETVVEKFVQLEKDDKVRYKEEVELWNKEHPEAPLVLDENGIASRPKQVDKELKEKQERKKAQKAMGKARMQKRSAPVPTKEMLAIGRKAAARLAKMKNKSQVQYESLSEGSVSSYESEVNEDSQSKPEESDDANLSTDDEAYTDEGKTGPATEKVIVQRDDGSQEEMGENLRGRKAKGKANKSKVDSQHGNKLKHATGTQPASKGVPKAADVKRGKKRNAHHDELVTAPLGPVLVAADIRQTEDLHGRTSKRKGDAKKAKSKRGSKRLRLEQGDTQSDEHASEEPPERQPKPAPKKAKKSKEQPGPVRIAADKNPTAIAHSAQPNAKRKRASKRRSQTAAEPPKPSSRRRSSESIGGQGEYCGEFALDD